MGRLNVIALFLSIAHCLSFYSVEGKDYEKIYAIMITGKDRYHESLARCAIQSFLEQTYPNKHLIIINDGTYQLNCDCDQITEIKLDKKYLLGALRNIGLQQIPEGSLWVQWDDDDWHHSDLIEKQYNFLCSKKADGCVLKNQICYTFRINAAWINSRSCIVGTIMCRKKNDVWYLNKSLSEDLVFYNNYKAKYSTIAWDNPEYYYLRFIHGHNSWGENHFLLAQKQRDEWLISSEAKDYLSKVLVNYSHFQQRTLRSHQQVFLYHWFPHAYKSNFGDELSPKIVERIVGYKLAHDKAKQQFLALGSILHFARDGAVIWGTGLNGKIPLQNHSFSRLDVRAVRGPLTRQFLLSKGIDCPEIYGDPALLMPLLFPELKVDPQKDYIIIPHINEMETVKNYDNVVLPIEDCMTVVNKILQAKFVISSSLHGIIVAEAFGIPARLLRLTEKENILKYKDYYYATGRDQFKAVHSVEEALKMGGEPMPVINLKPLLDSFPYDKFN